MKGETKMHVKHKPAARILVLLLAVTTVLAFTPAVAWTQDVQAGVVSVTVNGIDVTAHEYWKWDSSTTTYIEGSGSSYNIHYTSDALKLKGDNHFTSVLAANTLSITLDNAEIQASDGTAIYAGGDMGVTLIGKNNIVNNNANGIGISTASSVVTFAGAGSLNITSTGTDIHGGSVNITGGNIAATCKDTSGGYAAIEGSDGINVSGGTLNVESVGTGAGNEALKVNANKNILITGGAVYAHGARQAVSTAAATIESSSVSMQDSNRIPYKYITVLSDSNGNASLAYASTSTGPSGDLVIEGVELQTNQTGVDMSAKAYGDYNSDGSKYSWSVNLGDSGCALALNNAYITSGNVEYKIHEQDMSVSLSGKNCIDLSDLPTGSAADALICHGSMTFAGSGSLEATASNITGDNLGSSGITAANGGITVNGPSVTGTAGSGGNNSTGVSAGGAITVNSGSLQGKGNTATSTSGEAYSYGVSAVDSIDASGGSVAGIAGQANAKEQPGDSIGVVVFVSDGPSKTGTLKGNITGVGSGTENTSYGISVEGEVLTIKGAGTVTAAAKTSAFHYEPSIDSSLNAVVKVGSEQDGSDAAVASSPTEETYTGNKYVQITTTAKAAPGAPTYDITGAKLVGGKLTYDSKPENGKDFKGKISTLPGYALPKKITITVGGQQLTDDQFSYDPLTGEFTIPGKYINGAVNISGTGMNMNLRARRMVESRLNLLVTTPSSKQGTGTSAKTADGVKKAAADTYGTVTVIKPIKKTYKSMSIPNTVTAYSYVYKVTAVSAKAFKNNTKLKSLTLGKNVKTVGAKACYNCQKLKSVKFAGKNITAISKGAFRTCAKNCRFMIPKAKYSQYVKMLKKSGVPEGAQYIKY